MNHTTHDRIANYRGDVIHKRGGKTLRLSLAEVSIEGVPFTVHYDVDGYYMPATEVDAAEYPVCLIHKLEICGVDVTRLFSNTQIESDIAEKIEQGWES